ncbi:hypothetical protein [Maritalea mediterranea]|uniref:Capsid Gp10A/Gp10B-like domain-containing protein n=1 Tax=Maritalea mediterranea TaxID=2909667 RepID=A0ABS9EC99_9HYPH|nr:hypothetical protein [Maritalea mediterranea]MCF4099789.1 hypothetical protein [Maritalea mediterranea]
MSQFSATNAGVPAGPSHADNLFLKTFSGETLKIFHENTVQKGRHRERTIKHGKSAQFPAIGGAVAEYHTPGHVILGQNIEHGEKVIAIDDLLTSSVFISNIEEAMNHYEVRKDFTFEVGKALADANDQHLFAIAAKACINGTTGAVTEMGPATVDNIGAAPTLSDIVQSFYDAAKHFDATRVPKNERYAFVDYSVYWDLIKDGSLLDRDFGNDNGNQADGRIYKVAGFSIVPTANLAMNFGVDTIAGKRAGANVADYTVDASNALILFQQKQALGTVKLMNLATEKEYQVNRQGTLVVSKLAVGHGVLRPECLRLVRASA